MKAMFILLLVSLSFASWESFCAMPIEEKMLLQNERLKQVENGSLIIAGLDLSTVSSMRAYLNEWIDVYSNKFQVDYSQAVKNVQAYIQSMPKEIKIIQSATKFIKVGDKYVSESICQAYPAECVVSQPTAPPAKVYNPRTPGECSGAREKDWEVFCWQRAKEISCDAVTDANKDQILDSIAEGYYSNQAVCLRGE